MDFFFPFFPFVFLKCHFHLLRAIKENIARTNMHKHAFFSLFQTSLEYVQFSLEARPVNKEPRKMGTTTWKRMIANSRFLLLFPSPPLFRSRFLCCRSALLINNSITHKMCINIFLYFTLSTFFESRPKKLSNFDLCKSAYSMAAASMCVCASSFVCVSAVSL